jgi:hypothetical protein
MTDPGEVFLQNNQTTQIGTMREKSLHAKVKQWYAQPGDSVEVPVDGFVIDIVRKEWLIEIQTRNFGQMKRKLLTLIEEHPVRLVYPIASEKWIVRVKADGHTQLSRRKSPKRGRLEHLFDELVSFPELVVHPNFELEVLFVRLEQILCDDGKGSWRRKRWSIYDYRLLGVVERARLTSPADFVPLLTDALPRPFTNQELATTLKLTRRLAQKMTYCLRRMGIISVVGKKGRAFLYE